MNTKDKHKWNTSKVYGNLLDTGTCCFTIHTDICTWLIIHSCYHHVHKKHSISCDIGQYVNWNYDHSPNALPYIEFRLRIQTFCFVNSFQLQRLLWFGHYNDNIHVFILPYLTRLYQQNISSIFFLVTIYTAMSLKCTTFQLYYDVSYIIQCNVFISQKLY